MAKRIASANRKLALTMMNIRPSRTNDIKTFEKDFS
jgi:hypothetical protein